MTAYLPLPIPPPLQHYDLFVFGDSIQEAWRGTGFGSRVGSRQENKRAWKKLVTPGGGYNSIVMGISGAWACRLLLVLALLQGPLQASLFVLSAKYRYLLSVS